MSMSDQQVPVSPSSDVKTPEQMIQDVKNSVSDTANSVLGEGTVDNFKQTATQVTATVGQVTNVVTDQVEHLSQKVWWQEFVGEVKDMVNPITDVVLDVIKIAFFLKPQQRISRWQYIIGSLSVVVVVGLFVSLLGVIIWPLGVWLWSLLIAIPLINLAIRRFHDLNKSGRWAISVVVPLVGWIMPSLFQWVNENNTYGPDPLLTQKADLTTYVITALSLLILSSIVTTVLGFLWLRVKEPQVDVTDPNTISNQIGGGTNTFQQPVNTTKNSATNTVNQATNNLR